jgi:asparagine synthase (glutamine-hydrolysing)
MIAAILHIDGTDVEPSLLAQMLAVGRPIAPDTDKPLVPTIEGTWVNKHIGLGVARFRLAEEPHTRCPPTHDASRQLMLAWEGRIDNREDIVVSLGSHWSTADDEALLLNAYAKWGVGCLEHLCGDFAFILWDGQTQRLLAVRDQMGVHPLHYTFDGQSLVIASRIGPLFRATHLAREVHKPMVADYLVNNWTNPRETLFRRVWRVPAAHALQYDRAASAPKVWRYWNVQADPPIRYRLDEDYVERFRELLRQAVQSRVRGSQKVGVLLSGGLDSSTVACIASDAIGGSVQRRQGRLDTFTAVYDEFPDIDERRYVDALVARGGLRSHYVLADELWTLRNDARRGAWDEPFENAFDSLMRGMLTRVKHEHVDVLLTGGFGDELIEGNLYYLHDLLVARRWAAFSQELEHWPRWRRPKLIQRYAVAPLLGRSLDSRYSLSVPSWVRHEFASQTNMRARMQAACPPKRFGRPSQQLDFAWIDYFSRLTMMLWMQAEGVRHEVDLRHPYLDSRLIDFLMRIPSWQKRRDPAAKGLLRAAMKGSMPSVVTGRPIAGPQGDHGKLFAKGLRHCERHRWEACFAGSSCLAELGAIRPAALRDAFKQYLRGDDSLGLQLVSAYRLEQWLRQQQGAPS